MMQVPLLDLKAQYATIRDDVRTAMEEVCEQQNFILGPQVEDLERQIAAYSQTRHAVGVSSGTDALLMALMALNIQPGDEVITTPYSFFATVGVLARLGARAVFADIDGNSYNIDPEKITRLVTAKTKAILPVHLFGQCADMDPIMSVAEKYNLPIIEDAAQAIGAEYKGRRAGSMGLVGCFSFFPSKNLGGFGDGGMVVTSDDTLAEKLRVLRVHGSKPKYYHKIVGGNFRLDAIQAAVLKVKLKHLDKWSRKRQENASFYDSAFVASGFQSAQVVTPRALWRDTGDAHYHIYNQYVIRVSQRDALQSFLRQASIGTEVYYPVPLHLQECFQDLGYSPTDFPNAEFASRHTLALPVYPELRAEQLRYVVSKIAEFFSGSPQLSSKPGTAELARPR